MSSRDKAKANIDSVLTQICEKANLDRFVLYSLIVELMEEDGFGEFEIDYLDVTIH